MKMLSYQPDSYGSIFYTFLMQKGSVFLQGPLSLSTKWNARH